MPADDRHVSPPKTGVCAAWATDADVCALSEITNPEETLPTVLDDSLLIASDVLFELTGRRWSGLCQDTVRPVLRGLSQDYGRPIRPPYPFGGPYGYWSGMGMSSFGPSWGFWLINRSDRAGGQIVPEITLGAYPLVCDAAGLGPGQSPPGWRVTVDGAPLPMFDAAGVQQWRVDDDRWLVRLADPVTHKNPGWPGFQSMDLPPTEPGTWEVQYQYGSAPPPGGVRAAATLGWQLALACSPNTTGKCRLPQRVTSLTRNGVTAAILDPMVFLKEGRTGLYEVDLWLNSVNHGAPFAQRARVLSPDVGRRVRRAGV